MAKKKGKVKNGESSGSQEEELFTGESGVDKDEALAKLTAKIKKEKGSKAVLRLDDEDEDCKVLEGAVISTGIPQIDRASHVGGLPFGRIVEIYGPEASGKTTVALHICAMAEKMGKRAVYIDVERALVKKHVLNCGVRNMHIIQPESGDDAFNIVREYLPLVDVVVLDSVSALVPESESEKDIGDAVMASQARLMSQSLRMLNGEIAKNNVLFIFINQVRMKVGLVFGNPEVTSGGQALRFYASMRIDVRRKDAIKQGDEVIGFNSKVKFVKNKMDSPLGEEEFTLYFDANRTVPANVLEFATEMGIVSKASGGWYSYKGEKIAQGNLAAIDALSSNKELFEKIFAECRENLFKPVVKLDSVL